MAGSLDHSGLPPLDPLEQEQQQLHAQLAAHAAAAAAAAMAPSMPGTLPDGRPIQVRPCKYYPNCAKMDDPEHNAMYSHSAIVKKPPRPPPIGAAAAAGAAAALGRPAPASMQLCGFGEHCKRCGDEEHLDKYIHSCKFGSRCKKIDDPLHLKRFIHVLPGQVPPVPTFTPTPRGPRLDAAAALGPYSAFPTYPPPFTYPYGIPPLPPASSYASATGAFPSSSHHSRAAAASYHPYGGGGPSSARDLGGPYGSPYGDRRSDMERAKDDWANMAATIAGYGAAAAAYGDAYGYGAYTGLPPDTSYPL